MPDSLILYQRSVAQAGFQLDCTFVPAEVVFVYHEVYSLAGGWLRSFETLRTALSPLVEGMGVGFQSM